MTTTALCFPITDEMPYKPQALRIPRYMLPSLLGKAEKEEAAARVFTLIHEKGAWTGITWREIIAQIKPEVEAQKADEQVMHDFYKAEDEAFRAIQRYNLLCFITLGVYALFAKKPTMPKTPQRKPGPFTGIFLNGADCVAEGLTGLLDDGLIRLEEVGEGDNAEQVFYPTLQLVEMLKPYTAQPAD